MKNWAKISTYIAVVWIMVVMIFLTEVYFSLDSMKDKIDLQTPATAMVKFYQSIDINSPLSSLFWWFSALILPSIILFILTLSFGREKKLEPQKHL